MTSLTYTVYLWTNVEIKEPEAESDTHASFESGFRNNSIVQNNNYSFYNYQNTPSFLSTSLYFFCVFWTSTIVVVFIKHLESPERRSVSPMSPDSLSRVPPFTLLCHAFKCPSPLLRDVVKSCGSSPTRATSIFLGYTYIHGKTCLLHHLLFKTCMWHRKGWGARNGVWWYPKRLNLTFFAGPIKSLFFFFFSFLFSQGSRRAQLRTQTSGSGPQSQSTWRRWSEPDRFWEC